MELWKSSSLKTKIEELATLLEVKWSESLTDKMLQRISTINQSVKGLLFVVKFSKVTAAAELGNYMLFGIVWKAKHDYEYHCFEN